MSIQSQPHPDSIQRVHSLVPKNRSPQDSASILKTLTPIHPQIAHDSNLNYSAESPRTDLAVQKKELNDSLTATLDTVMSTVLNAKALAPTLESLALLIPVAVEAIHHAQEMKKQIKKQFLDSEPWIEARVKNKLNSFFRFMAN